MGYSVLVLGLKDLRPKERLMDRDWNFKETLQAACIAETRTHYMKSLKSDSGKVESANSVIRKVCEVWPENSEISRDRKNCMSCRICGTNTSKHHALLLDGVATS